jgi:hypothetical protein
MRQEATVEVLAGLDGKLRGNFSFLMLRTIFGNGGFGRGWFGVSRIIGVFRHPLTVKIR